MTIEQIRKACRTETIIEKNGPMAGMTKFRTSISFFSEHYMDPVIVNSEYGESAKISVQEYNIEQILHMIYDSQRKELYDGIQDLFAACPYDQQKMLEARDRILATAKYQKPQGE